MANAPKFTETFNVGNTNPENYRNLIEGLRNRLRQSDVHDRPMLPPQQNPPTEWFDIALVDNDSNITLRIRRDNLYLDGYQMSSTGQWWEFGVSNPSNPPSHLIEGSSFLEFDGGYPSLEQFGSRRRENTPLGQQPLQNAVGVLNRNNNTQEERARALMVLIQMICESIRFDRISSHLVNTYNGTINDQGQRIYDPAPMWMLLLENSWGNMSDAVVHADADFEYDFPRWAADDMVIENSRTALNALGILLYACYAKRSHLGLAIINQCSQQGRPLLEVSSVVINNIDGEDPGQLFGTIMVNDGMGTQYLYNRTTDNCESISPGRTVSLSGPVRCISSLESFIIDLDLKDYDSLSYNDEISKGQISWNVYNVNNEYDKVLYQEVRGQYGLVTVNYLVLRDAVQAAIEVTLTKGDENTNEVYGIIDAGNNNLNINTLFRKTSDDYIAVTVGDIIPLTRSVVAVSLSSTLKVSATLKDEDTISHDDWLANGFVLFDPQPFGTSEKSIQGEYGEVKVKVTWSV